MERKKRKIIKKISVLKLLGIILKVSIIIICVYAIVNRIQDVNGLDFFFTTWK